MKRILSICLVALGVISMAWGANRAAATPMRPPPCPSVSLPGRIAALKPLINSETWALFKQWDLQRISTHVCEIHKPYHITADYVLPAAYSPKNLTYHFKLSFDIDEREVVTNAQKIRLVLLRLDEKIAGFEHDPVIEQYLAIGNEPQIESYQDLSSAIHMDQIKLSINADNWLVYDLTYRHVLHLHFIDPVLIANKEKLVPALANLPEEPPPGHNIGIDYDVPDNSLTQFDASRQVLGATWPVVGEPPSNEAARERGGSLLFWVPVLLLGLFVIGMFTRGEAGRPRG
jgi:hypothetical protein